MMHLYSFDVVDFAILIVSIYLCSKLN